MSALEQAADLAANYGKPVFPCRLTEETINGRLYTEKSPLTTHGYKDATTDLEQIEVWWRNWPDALVGVPTGSNTGLLVVDIDPVGATWYAENSQRLKCGRIHKTPRGWHLLFRMPEEDIRNDVGQKLAPGVDVRANGGYIIWWPAHGFEPVGDPEDVGHAPEWLLELLRSPGKNKQKPSQTNGRGTVGEKGRNDFLSREAFRLRRTGCDLDQITQILQTLNQTRCSPPLDADEVRGIAERKVRNVESEGTGQSHNTKTISGPASEQQPFELVDAALLLGAQNPPVWTVEGLLEAGVNAGFVAPPEHAKSLLALHMAASVATGHPFNGRSVRKGLVVYLCGEGFGGMRKRLQALSTFHEMDLSTAPLVISRTSASLLDTAEAARVRIAIDTAEGKFGTPLALLVVDTLSRFIAPGKESDAPDMGAYFQAVDYLRGSATAISLHHPGHGDQTRARGSSSWRAALDTEYTFTMAGDVVTVSCSKMKDADKPSPLSFRIQQAPTLTLRDDGEPVTSVVLVPTDLTLARKMPTGKNQKLLLAELERLDTDPWTETQLREIARSLDMRKNSARDAVLGLRQLGYLTPTIGGSRLTHRDEGTKTGRKDDFGPVVGTKTGDEKGVSL